jgi:hypothetical protein
MAFILRDDQQQSYHELWDQILTAAETKGFAQVVEDVFCFNMTAGAINDEVTRIYSATQVRVDKLTGSGEDINAGQKVYATLASNFQSVTANPAGVIGTDYYFVGWAKKDAAANETDVLIRFEGDEYNHADRAA